MLINGAEPVVISRVLDQWKCMCGFEWPMKENGAAIINPGQDVTRGASGCEEHGEAV